MRILLPMKIVENDEDESCPIYTYILSERKLYALIAENNLKMIFEILKLGEWSFFFKMTQLSWKYENISTSRTVAPLDYKFLGIYLTHINNRKNSVKNFCDIYVFVRKSLFWTFSIHFLSKNDV